MKKYWKLLIGMLALSFTLGVAVACGGGDEQTSQVPQTSQSSQGGSETGDGAEITGVTFSGAEFDYDGTEKKIEVSGLPTGVSVSYSNNAGTNAGTYNATAVLTGEGYKTKTLTAVLKINKISYDMSGASWNYSQAYTYDGSQKSVAVSGLPSGVTVKAYANNEKTNAGEYTASVTFAYDEVNYNQPTMANCSWKINRAEITAQITLTSNTVEYDTQQHSLQIVGNIPSGCTVNYTYNGQAVDGVTEVGDYEVRVTISGENYITKTLTATLKIKSTESLLYAINHNGTIYFQNDLDDKKLYKISGTTIEKVNNDKAENFFSDGTDLYYYSSSLFSKTIKKISGNGKASTVYSVSGEYLTSDGTYIYYAVNNALVNTSENGIYKYKLDGSQDEPVRITTDKGAYLCVEGDYLYYSNLSQNKYLYRIALTGGSATCLHEEKVEYIISANGVIYFDASKTTGSAIYKYNTSTATKTKMTTDSGKYLTKVGNDIYYVNNDLLTSTLFGDGIYKISVLSSGSLPGTKVVSENGNGYSSLTSDGTYLYYYKLNDKHLYRYNPVNNVETDMMANFKPPVEDITLMGDTKIAGYNGEIYYTNPLDAMGFGACLYKYNPTTHTRVKVLSEDVAGVWFNGDYMYYSTCVLTNYALFRMNMKTHEIVKINSDRCENLIFEGNDIYYIKVDALTRNKIMKMNANDITATPTVIYDDKNIAVTGMTKLGDTFYFVMNPAIGYQKLYKYTVGDSKGVDLDQKAFETVVIGNKLYFYDDGANAIKSCALDGSGVATVVSSVKVNDLYVSGTKLYYSSTQTTVGVYVYDTANSSNVKIADKPAEAMLMVENKLWFIQTAVNYTSDYPVHSGDGDGALYCYDGTAVSKK